MQIEIPVGLQGHETKIVEKKDTAKHYGSGLAEVFATPAMIALMEYTAFTSIEPFLPEGYSSVGIQINAHHKKASLPGSIITCKSNVTKVEGKKIYYSINAWDEEGEIGSAEHIRYIINTEEFLKKLEKK
ncbi:MAG: thioesterase family protein [Salinivirgaceae bacterium]|nr:thioesterase family protein [Salinivirgaceae bacterium]